MSLLNSDEAKFRSSLFYCITNLRGLFNLELFVAVLGTIFRLALSANAGRCLKFRPCAAAKTATEWTHWPVRSWVAKAGNNTKEFGKLKGNISTKCSSKKPGAMSLHAIGRLKVCNFYARCIQNSLNSIKKSECFLYITAFLLESVSSMQTWKIDIVVYLELGYNWSTGQRR